MTTPRELGKAAYAAGVSAPAHDADLMAWLKANTSGVIGSSIAPMDDWYAGWFETQEQELRRQFPELYP